MLQVIVIRGVMGSGKTTVASHFKNFQQRWAVLHADDFKKIFDHFEKNARPVVGEVMVAALKSLLEQKYNAVIEGVLQDVAMLERAQEVSVEMGAQFKVFELTAALDVLVKRDRQLSASEIQAIQAKLQKRVFPGAVVIDTTEVTIEDLISEIKSHFSP